MVFVRTEGVTIAETVVFYIVGSLVFLSHFILGCLWYKYRKYQPLRTRGEGPILAILFYSLRNLIELLTGRYAANGPAFGYTVLPRAIHCYTANVVNYPLLVSVVIVKLWMHIRIQIKVHLYKFRYNIAHNQTRVTPKTRRYIRMLQWASSRKVHILGVVLSILILASIIGITLGIDAAMDMECELWDATYITRRVIWSIFFVIASVILLQIIITRSIEILYLKRPLGETGRTMQNTTFQRRVDGSAAAEEITEETPMPQSNTNETMVLGNQTNRHTSNHRRRKGLKSSLKDRWHLWRLIDPFYLDLEYFWFYTALFILLLYIYFLMAFREFRTSLVYGSIIFLLRLNFLLSLVAFPAIITIIWERRSYSVWRKIGYDEETGQGKLKFSVQHSVIENALHDPDFHDAFMSHLRREQCFENLLFWDKIQELKRLPRGSSRQRRLARDIYYNYLAPDSVWRINTNEAKCEHVRRQLGISQNDPSVQDSFYATSRPSLPSTPQQIPPTFHPSSNVSPNQSPISLNREDQNEGERQLPAEISAAGNEVSISTETTPRSVRSEPTLSRTGQQSTSNSKPMRLVRKVSAVLLRPFYGKQQIHRQKQQQQQQQENVTRSSEELEGIDMPGVFQSLEHDTIVLMSDAFVRFLQSEKYEELQRKRQSEFKEVI